MLLQEIEENHVIDEAGNPAGGSTHALGMDIFWQSGPLSVAGPCSDVRLDPNGCFVETVIAAAMGRLNHYQGSKFASDYNEKALMFLGLALDALHARTADREERGVEGTYNV